MNNKRTLGLTFIKFSRVKIKSSSIDYFVSCFSGFATFKNTEEGEVKIVGVGGNVDACDMSTGSNMLLSTQDLGKFV